MSVAFFIWVFLELIQKFNTSILFWTEVKYLLYSIDLVQAFLIGKDLSLTNSSATIIG